MTEPVSSTNDQQQNASSSSTLTITESDQQDHTVPTVKVKLRKTKPDRKVKWTSNTVDNENLNRKKSKCCCIYDKPRKFGESSSEESDDECDHCKGHVEKKGQHMTEGIGDTIPDQHPMSE